ncbi:hypothetical protein PHYBOEH_006199 [Phytophthora boehmeriae]|uniref:Uncharacterized protein n=1 Tax=Phytophthora boehmeriae TaxID=109152 RepID=A0A8T1WGW3_9STRA|nr:hypothetical protein PHYBOEH_006199 [Phytophthora boehmeriae]
MSSFFGLTMLGSQSPFDNVKATPIHAFQPRDFQDAFMQTYQPGFSLYSESDEDVAAANATLDIATITRDQLPTLLRVLYKCPKGVDNVPDGVRALVEHAFDTSEPIGLATFLAQMDEVCRFSQDEEFASARKAYLKDGLPSREFISNIDFRAKLVKHQRMQKNPQEKVLAPMTDSLTIGWNSPTMETKRKPNKSCEETRFASAMVKAGVYYY